MPFLNALKPRPEPGAFSVRPEGRSQDKFTDTFFTLLYTALFPTTYLLSL